MPYEAWKPIPGYEDCYEVSSKGRVRSKERIVVGRRGFDGVHGTRRLASRVRKVQLNRSGYEVIVLTRGGKQRSFLVHRLVLLAFQGEPDPGQEARHLNGDRLDNRVSNLRWGTREENTADRVKHVRHYKELFAAN